MKKIIFIILLIIITGSSNAKDKFYKDFEFNGRKYKCELIYERSELIPTYTLNIQSKDLKTKILKSSTLIIKKQDYTHNMQTNVETWERFLKRRSSNRIPKDITFHIVGENKSYAVYGFGRGILKEHYLNNELCLVKDRESKIYIYPNESIIFAVVRNFLKSIKCLPNETVITRLN
ncbi:MAG: hypothetical protein KJ571_13880 [Bacteroidetes bacterium]|nr:hypothetical protein [Bacteroidota bacterium]